MYNYVKGKADSYNPNNFKINYHPDLVFQGVVFYEQTKMFPTLEQLTQENVTLTNDIIEAIRYKRWLENDGKDVPDMSLWLQ